VIKPLPTIRGSVRRLDETCSSWWSAINISEMGNRRERNRLRKEESVTERLPASREG
jgi:hypothetical protein